MKKFNLFCGFLMLFLFGNLIIACSKDNDDDDSVASLKGTWLWVDSSWNIEDTDYPYFIVQDEYCYFCKSASVNSWGEKYKYVYDESHKNITVWQVYKDGTMDDDSDNWQVLKLTNSELQMVINGDETVTFKKN